MNRLLLTDVQAANLFRYANIIQDDGGQKYIDYSDLVTFEYSSFDEFQQELYDNGIYTIDLTPLEVYFNNSIVKMENIEDGAQVNVKSDWNVLSPLKYCDVVPERIISSLESNSACKLLISLMMCVCGATGKDVGLFNISLSPLIAFQSDLTFT